MIRDNEFKKHWDFAHKMFWMPLRNGAENNNKLVKKSVRYFQRLNVAGHAFFESVMLEKKKGTDEYEEINYVNELSIRNSQNEFKNILDSNESVNVAGLTKENCCGCGSCFNSCPMKAISMAQDEEGFLYPAIDFLKCTNCGLCKSRCPEFFPKYKNNAFPDCYAVMANNEIRAKSASGGAFTLAANFVLNRGGTVFGAAYNDNFYVMHMGTSNAKELNKLRSSKYVQSDTAKTYEEAKRDLEEDKYVLYSGCPCQIAGLYAYLEKDYEKLFTVDVICRGVPSPKLFDKYLTEKHGLKNGRIKHINFRDKSVYGWSYEMNVFYNDGEEYHERNGVDSYWRAFISGLSSRPACSSCKYSTLPRQADLSLGDFWGIGRYDKLLDDRKGTSLVLVNNPKGQTLIESIQNSEFLYKFEKRNIREARPRNIGIDQSYKTHHQRDRFMKLIESYEFDKAVDYGYNRYFDIGIIGLWYGENYGSMLTYYALYNVLTQDLKLSVLMIDNPLSGLRDGDESMPSVFGKRYYETNKNLSVNLLGNLNNYCDAFIVGSDQLWNYHLSRPCGETYFLNFVSDDKKKIAYGTSFGQDRYNAPKAYYKIAKAKLERFDAVSVREDSGIKICKESFGIDAEKVCDPVFLCDTSVLADLADKSSADIPDEQYIFAYILDPTPEKRDLLIFAAKQMNKRVILFFDEAMKLFEDNKNRIALEDNCKEVLIKETVVADEWLKFLKEADFVITDSFHGACLSSLFKKSFVAIKNERRGAGRFLSALSPFKLESRIANDAKDVIDNYNEFFSSIDYSNYDEYLIDIRKKSFDWLSNAIKSPRVHDNFVVYPSADKRVVENLSLK